MDSGWGTGERRMPEPWPEIGETKSYGGHGDIMDDAQDDAQAERRSASVSFGSDVVGSARKASFV